ncbi:MAG: HIT domain-containing protein [Candidatus Saccharibacteria bacterium]
MTERHVNLSNTRYDDQREHYEAIVDDGVCPFCIDVLKKYVKQPILIEGEHWVATTNRWPYENTDAHFLLIARQHVETITELPKGAFEELGDQVKQLIRDNDLEYGGLAMRFGDIRYTGATVSHLHAHVLQARKDLPDDTKVKFKFSR